MKTDLDKANLRNIAIVINHCQIMAQYQISLLIVASDYSLKHDEKLTENLTAWSIVFKNI